ncbi:hypothetical protein FGB62_25g642 [Gracilaria domingensis]|nr:hypothetical protein FGB62_25g642 [Gracilaria domingensis]
MSNPTYKPGAKLSNVKSLYLEGIRDGKARYAVEKYTGDRYTQHSTGVRDGVEGFVEFFDSFLKRNPYRDIQIIRGWEDGNHVFVHAYQDINKGESKWVTADFFDTDDNDKIIEHWDIIEAYTSSPPSGHTVLDGATEIVDLDKTESNKQVVREIITQVFMAGGDPSRADEFIAEPSSDTSDGLSYFRERVTSRDRKLSYQEIVLCVGQGNFVSTLCKATLDGKPHAQCDIFRLANNKIVEHWDNGEPIGPESEWVNSGKF